MHGLLKWRLSRHIRVPHKGHAIPKEAQRRAQIVSARGHHFDLEMGQKVNESMQCEHKVYGDVLQTLQFLEVAVFVDEVRAFPVC